MSSETNRGEINGWTDGQNGNNMLPQNFSGSIKTINLISSLFLANTHINK
jgi:hypothetical protein